MEGRPVPPTGPARAEYFHRVHGGCVEYFRRPPLGGFMDRHSMAATVTEREELLESLGVREAVLVHYDTQGSDGRARTALNRFLFGRVDVKAVDGGPKTYRYPGLADAGAEWVGQSVFLLKLSTGERLIAKLRELGICHSVRTVYVPVRGP